MVSNPTQNNGPDDGLIQSSFAQLSFYDIFTQNVSGDWEGYLAVDFNAPSEPYTAFDFVELSLAPLQIDAPEPTSILLMGLGLLGLGFNRRKFKN